MAPNEAAGFPESRLCALCGQPTLGNNELCAFHLHGSGEDWATGNRIICDFVHRGFVAPAPCARAVGFDLRNDAVGP